MVSNFVNLDNVMHADTKVDNRPSAAYGDQLNQVRVLVTEFEELQREYAIFFRKTESGEFYAVALLGLDKDENLFLEDMEWKARYIPAVLQRGPFQIGIPQNSAPIIKIDMGNPRVNAEYGKALFKPNGGLTPYLEKMSKTLKKIHVGLEMNGEFFQELSEAFLIESVSLDLMVNDEMSYKIPELFSIDEAAFKLLKGPALEKFHTSGLLSLCQFVLASRKNISHLIDLKLVRMNTSS